MFSPDPFTAGYALIVDNCFDTAPQTTMQSKSSLKVHMSRDFSYEKRVSSILLKTFQMFAQCHTANYYLEDIITTIHVYAVCGFPW